MNTPVKILIVEDSEDDAKLALRALRGGGFEPTHRRVQTAADLKAVLAAERWDAVISDFSMPGFTGMDALEIFRAAGLDIPFILISGTIGEETAVQAMKAGASDYLMKQSLTRLAPVLERELKETQMRAAHRQAQEALTVSEERFRQVAENIRDVFFLIDINSNQILYASSAYENIWGRSCESLYANSVSWAEAIHPDDRAAVGAIYTNGMASGKFEFVCRIVRPDGLIRWIEARGFPVRDTAGKLVRIAGVAADISERTKSAQELRESERRFSDLLQNVGLISVMLDREARITYCNEYLIQLTGWQYEEVIGQNWFELFIPPETDNVKDVFGATLGSLPNAWHHENEILTRAGERRLIRWNNSVLRSATGDVIGTASIGEDITEQKRNEIKIKRLNRVYAVQSGINALIVRVHDRDELFREACRIAVDAGAFRTAWIGVIDPQTLDGKVVAWYGAEQSYVDTIKLAPRNAISDSEPPACRALRLGQTVICNDIATEPSLAPRRDVLLQRGYHSLGCFPLMLAGRPEAVLALFADEPDYFDAEEVELLADLAANLSFALDNLEQEKTLKIIDAQRREGEESLRRFSSAMDATADAIYLVDRNSMRFIHVNDAACRMQDQTREELLALGPVALLASSRAELEHTYDAIIASGADAEPFELLRSRKDGSLAWVELRRHAQRSGEHWTIITLVRDITERKDAERHLVQMEGRYRGLLEAAPDAMVVVNQGGEIVLLNLQAEKQFGYRRDELVGQKVKNIIPKGFAERLVADGLRSAADALAQQIGTGIELTGRRKDGSDFPIEIMLSPLESAEGILVTAAVRDITRRKDAETHLVQMEGRYRGLLEAAPDAMVVVNQDGEIVLLNLQAEKQFGFRRDELVGQKVKNIIPEGFAERLVADGLRSAADALAQQIGTGIELTGRRKDGSDFPIEIMLSPLESAEGILVTAAIRDISERKAAENRIRRLNRVYAVLSGINTLIVRVRDRDELFREACAVAVEAGGFRLAWIGLVDRVTMELIPVAAAGSTMDAGTLVNQRFSLLEDAPLGNTLSASAIREKKAVFANDVPNDPRVVFKTEHAQRGSRSMAILPLLVADETVGVLALYAEEIGFFDDAELKLLTELAGDIAFAIDHIGKAAKLNYLAYYDPLTGLANRSLFLDRAAQYMRSAVSGGHRLAIFLIDLERFKNINDSLGRPAGDALLRQIAEWLTRSAGDASLVARLGADHFALVLPQVRQEGDVVRLLEKTMADSLNHPFRVNDAVFRIAAKVGVAVFPDDGADTETLFRNAEAALKKAKASGERYLFYTQAMTAAVAGKLTLENQLRQALDNQEFVLHYQPKVSLASGKITGAEALIRWNDPLTGLVPPGRFIPILEETGLIYEVGRWALRQAIADYLRWRAAGLPAVRIAVNVSPLQLRNRGFIDEVEHAIAIDAQAAAGLELEITESVIMEDVKHNIACLQAIRSLGVRIAIDDFGTGFSSLSYLARLPVDTLKIDRSFVIDMTAGPQGMALVSTIIKLAHSLKLKVVAEGVETEEQKRLLHLLDCDEMQGFLFSKPLPVEIFEARYLALPRTTPV